jgi:5-methylcytosine-specific restriction endonuclease McrA
MPIADAALQMAVWFHSWGADAIEPSHFGPRAGGHKRRCILHGCHYEPVRTRVVLERDGWACQICGSPLKRVGVESVEYGSGCPTVDHVIPLAMGKLGPGHTIHNLIACCRGCNMKKRDQNPTGWSCPWPRPDGYSFAVP